MTTMQTLLRRPSRHHVSLADRVADTEPLTVDALLVRWAVARPVDAEFAERLRAAVLEVEVTERLRAL
jgi:hypothetical protein